MAEPLDPLTLPLWGSRLIEASAGTGKTWTIAALYLRLVLGHGGFDHGFGRPLLPSEILVMTFTRAATRELSDRIRGRLIEAARAFRGELPAPADDPLLASLLAAYPEGPVRAAAAWRLAMAAENMDDAAVHTIDAWCQRMLREHAFDSGSLFDEELGADERAMTDEAARDYWRQQVYPLAGAALDHALAVWPTVESLAADARQLVEDDLPDGAGQGSLADRIAALADARGAAIAALKPGWAVRAAEMGRWLDAQLDVEPCPFEGRKLQRRFYRTWIVALADWANDPEAEIPDLKTGATRLTPGGIRQALKPGAALALPGHFAALEQLLQALRQLPQLAVGLRLHAAARIAARLAELKRQAASFGFADMLNRLDRALDPDAAVATGGDADSAARLRSRIVQRYPVALVDEFQDTSPLQARIFDRLYRIADNCRDTGLLLIGDPKQSIYRFRGADIHSYLAARRATGGRHAMLATTRRSTAALVAAVNHVFGQAESRLEAGAFLFRGDASGGNGGGGDSATDPLPFLPVAAGGRAERFVTSDGPAHALAIDIDDELVSADGHRQRFAARCAERITRLLDDRGAGFERPDGRDGNDARFVRLRPADIAVLVRTGREAAAVRRELRRRDIASVYLSDQQSVFAGDEARDLLRWLEAVASPRDARLARAALATRTVGLPLAELARLAANDEAFDARSEQLRSLHAVWQSQGVLAMLRQSLHLLDLPARWLAPPDAAAAAAGQGGGDGERRLTNVRHLAELLQAARGQLDGEHALIRWLAGCVDGGPAGGDEQIVRLESDADLVKVVTVHKAKGLEYPLVLLPFASTFRAEKRSRHGVLRLTDGQGRRSLVLQPDDDQLAAAERERLREDLRLLYVAMTRARHALWIGFGAVKLGNSDRFDAQRSAIGYLLCGADPVQPSDLAAVVGAALRPCPEIGLQPAEPASAGGPGGSGANAAVADFTRLRPRDDAAPLRALEPYAADFDRSWAIGSFSALVRDLGAAAAEPADRSPAELRDDEPPAPASDAGTQVFPAAVASNPAAPWHAFPRGALAGNFLHDQLEWLAGEGFALAASPELRQQLLRRCDRQGWGHRADEVLAWLLRVVGTPLAAAGVALDAIGTLLPEMEFWVPSDGLAAGAVDALCRQHLLGGAAAGLDRPPLAERQLQGMLMGFADLVFTHDSRYWVLDYKSNHLGRGDADYGQPALAAAVAAHRYDVQAALYLLALHRLLRARLGADYDPARQLGGAIFLFLRGIDGPCGGSLHLAAPPPLLDGLDALLSGAGAAQAGR